MNERYKELRRQATLVETYTSHDGSAHEGRSVDLEKFAELIVRECANIAADQSAIRPEYRIRKHFGVEE